MVFRVNSNVLNLIKKRNANLKLHSNIDPSILFVSGYGPGYIKVGERTLNDTFVLTPSEIHTDLGIGTIQTLNTKALTMLEAISLEILLIGTGELQQAPPVTLIAELSSQRIGVEYMATPAACRTFNILAAEQRRVAALLFIDNRYSSES